MARARTRCREVLSYGEDPLTYWVLTQRLPDLLSQLSDRSSPKSVLVIYRPLNEYSHVRLASSHRILSSSWGGFQMDRSKFGTSFCISGCQDAPEPTAVSPP